jgi:uncharacterized repeat protein (TIGR01451 family)
MQKSIWKLAALAGVIGVGFLGVMQAQRGLSPSGDEKNAKTQFEDFDSPGLLDENDDTVAGKESDDELGFGQFEPIDENGGRESRAAADDLNSEFQVADGGRKDRQSDPFAENSDDPESAKPNFDEFFPQESDSPSAGGRDFPNVTATETTGIPEQPGSAQLGPMPTSNDEPLDDGFRPIKDNDTPTKNTSANVASSKRDANSLRVPRELVAPGVLREAKAPGASSNADGKIIRQVSQFEAEPDATTQDNDDSHNPFADDGPRLLAPADDPRPIDEPTGTEFETQPSKVAPGDNANTANPFDSPFDRSPRGETPQENSKSADLSAFDDLDDPKAEEMPTADDSPFPDPAAFDDAPQNDALPPTKQSASQDETNPSTFQPFDDEPAGPEVERVPFPAAEAQPSITEPANPLPSKSQFEKKSAKAAVPPNRLTPHSDAVRLVPPTEDDLAGDATLGANAPRGLQRPQLSIVKQAPPKAVLGQSMIYSIIVKNIGDSPAAQVIVEDHIPRGTKLTGTIPQAEMYKKTLVWKLGTLKPNEQRTIQVRVVPFEAGQIGSIATVNFVTEVAARTLVTAPSLKLNVASPARASVGGRVMLTFKVTNNGTSKATGVVLQNLLPAQLSHPGGNDLEYQVGDLAAGQSKDISLQLTAAKAGKAISKAVITADGNLNAEATANIDVVGSQLELTRSGPKRRYLGRAAVYVNRVTNTSGSPIGPITIIETLPGGLKFVKATNGGQFNQVRRTIAWQIDKLAAGESKDVSVEVTATSRGTQSSQVTATGSDGVVVRVESKTDVVGLAALSANLTGITGPLSVGKTVTLQVRVANRGNEPATGIKVQLELSDQLTFVTSDGPVKATAGDGKVSFASLKTIGPQEEQTLTIVLKAIRPGEARLKVQIDADQLSRPITRDDALIIEESP